MDTSQLINTTSLAIRRNSMKQLRLCILPTTSQTNIINKRQKSTNTKNNNIQPQYHSSYQQGPLAILPHLYIGNEKNAHTLSHLDGIDCLLNVAAEVDRPACTTVIPWSDQCVKTGMTTTKGYVKLATEQHGDQLQLDDAMLLIDQAKSHNKVVLVHCQCGVARSATVVIAYIMHFLRIPLHEAYTFVQRRAPAIGPNLSLLYQLQSLEYRLERLHQDHVTRKPMRISNDTNNTKKRKLSVTC
ncbi:protein-tyrosine phosphatase-like protein [Halteromyces radiatus]|uniref:protein-tyrosine phosphatase-like protein n=1 Tax=Halteromyces radiatus TaxID=101107 RepID=UPI002220F738|nr:protein-tyrosine phosphatase-like protein [Halteromyces radiatus]KAI8097435.1 protein-tyrosine phosphatase-like protein [Halteromyces radiatus]